MDMTATFVDVPVPQDLYSRLESTAKRLEKSAETFLTEALQVILASNNQLLSQPKPQGEIPTSILQDIGSLGNCEVADLQKISQSEMELDQQAAMDNLLYLQRVRALTAVEEQELDALRMEYGHVMLRKARSFALLAAKGHPLPALQ